MNDIKNILNRQENFTDRLKSFFNPSCKADQTARLIASLQDALQTSPSPETVDLGSRLVESHRSDQTSAKAWQAFDQILKTYRKEPGYLHPVNQKIYEKCKQAGIPDEIIYNFFEFAQFLESSTLLSQLKMVGGTVEMENGEPALLVEGKQMPWSEIKKRFEIFRCPKFKTRFVVDKALLAQNPGHPEQAVYTYLGNGQGLQNFHPNLFDAFKPTATLNDSALEQVQQTAQKFSQNDPRDQSISRPHVLQIVTSYKDWCGNSNLSKVILKGRHSWIRVIAGNDVKDHQLKKGDVCSIGFQGKINKLWPFAKIQGQFRSPDRWEYVSDDAHYVTNIPMSDEEIQNVLSYALDRHQTNTKTDKTIGFHAPRQNCTVFSKEAAKRAGIEMQNEMKFSSLLWEVTPDIFKKIGSQIRAWYQAAVSGVARCLRTCLPDLITGPFIAVISKVRDIVKKIFGVLLALALAPVRIVLEGFRGKTRESLAPEGKPLKPLSQDLKTLPKIETYWYSLPSKVIEWQNAQASTVKYDRHSPDPQGEMTKNSWLIRATGCQSPKR